MPDDVLIQITFQSEPREIWDGYWHLWRMDNGFRTRSSLYMLAAAAVAACLFYLVGESVLLAVAGGLLVLAVFPWAVPLLMAIKTAPFERRVVLSEEGILTAADRIESRVPWNLVVGLEVDDTHVVVRARRANTFVLARSVFADAAQEAAFVEIVSSHITISAI